MLPASALTKNAAADVSGLSLEQSGEILVESEETPEDPTQSEQEEPAAITTAENADSVPGPGAGNDGSAPDGSVADSSSGWEKIPEAEQPVITEETTPVAGESVPSDGAIADSAAVPSEPQTTVAEDANAGKNTEAEVTETSGGTSADTGAGADAAAESGAEDGVNKEGAVSETESPETEELSAEEETTETEELSSEESEEEDEEEEKVFGSGKLLFRGNNYSVTIEYGEDAKIPEAAELRVRELEADSDEYQAHYETAKSNAEENGAEVRTAKFFDITIVAPEKDSDSEDAAEESWREIEPAAPVKVNIVFDKEELELPENAEVEVLHFADENNAETVEKEKVEVETSENSEGTAVSGVGFDADAFSVFGIVGTEVISGGDETFNITQDGWTVTVHTPEGAFPAGTEMKIERVTDPGVLVKLMSALDSRKVYDIAAVDISFSYNGEEIEPVKEVDVTLKSNLLSAEQYQIVHLKNDEEAEIITDATLEVGKAEFTLDSFSVVASAIEQDHVDKSAFKVFDGSTINTYISGQPANDLTPGAPASVVPVIPGYVFVNATINDGTTGEAAASNVEVTYFGSFISDGTTYVYYKTETDTMDLIVHVQDNEFIQLNYLPEDNYYKINYSIAGDTSETSLDEVFGTDRTTRAINNSSDIGYTVTIPRGYTATVTRNGTTVATLGVEPTYTVSNNKIITKNGELTLTNTYTIPKTNADQNIVVTLTKRTSFTFDASKFLSTVYTGGNSTTMGDNTVNTNSNARIQGDGTLGRSGTNKGKKTFTGNEVSWTFTTNNTENSHWLLDALQINGTDINVPYGDSGPVTKTTELPSGAVVTVTLNSVTGTGRNARRNYTITVSNVYEDVVISGGNIYNADNSVEIITEVLSNVDYSFYGFSSSDNAYNSSVRPGWVNWGEGEPIGELTSGTPQNSGTYHMYWFGTNTTNNGMRFTVNPGYIKPELAFVTSTEGDLHNYVNGLSFGSMSDTNGKYYPITSSPNSNGYYVFTITGMGSNKLALLRIRAELAEYGVTYSSGGVTTTAGTMPENEYGKYNVEDKDTIVLSSNIPVDSSGEQTFSYYWTIQGGGNTQYAPGQSISLADVAQYAVEDGEGRLVIPFVAHWTRKEQAKQVNYRIEYWVDGNDPSKTDDDVMKFFYSMLAPEGSAIYVNKNSDYIQNFLEVYHGLLEYDEENSASYVGNLQEGDIVRLRFQWVRHPLIIEKEVDSVNTTDYNKDFEMSLSSHRAVEVPKYDESTATIDPDQTETKTDNESWDNFTLKNADTQEFSVMREATINFEELESSWSGFHDPTYILTTYEEDGTTVKEERTVTKNELSEIKVTEKMKVTVKNEHGRVTVNKLVAVEGDLALADVNDTIYFALQKRGESGFVQKNGAIYTIPVTITNGVASPATVTFTGIEDGEYEVWELSDTNGTSKSVGDIIQSGDKTVQISQIEGITENGFGNNITVTGNGTTWARFTNTYTDASESIFFLARKRWMSNSGDVGNQYAPNGGTVTFTIYQQGGTSENPIYTAVTSVTMDGSADSDPESGGVYGWEYDTWRVRFDNLPREDANGQIKYVVKETSAPAGYVAYKGAGTSAEYIMGDDEYLENNGGSIYNRRTGQGLIIKKVGDDAPNGLAGASFTLDSIYGHLTTGEDGIAASGTGEDKVTVFTLPIRAETYAVTETKAPQYYSGLADSINLIVSDNGIVIPADTQDASISGPDANGAYTLTITNKRQLASITIKKVDDNHTFLPGAKFKLFKVVSEEESGETIDQIVGDEFIIDGEEGITISNLPSGNYKLTETHAPDGYVIISDPIEFTVNAPGTGNIITWKGTKPDAADCDPTATTNPGDTITVKNTPGVALPSTGGPGTKLFTILGLAMMLGAGVMLFRRRRLI